MKSYSLILGLIGVLVIGIGGSQDPASIRYNASTETTVQGKILHIDEFACPVSDGEMREHLVLQTANGTVQVHLAASRIMRSVNFPFKPGEEIAALGSKIKLRGHRDVIAREIIVGDEIFRFRDSFGQLLLKQQ
jgi:DNA/RNA endonuclease YhcR with UshA esterase domain